MPNQIASKINPRVIVSPRNIKLIVEYLGSGYCGWQTQNKPLALRRVDKTVSIQEALENTLHKILQEKVKITGSGRTDSGVHAVAQVANFRTKSHLSLSNIGKAMNSLLPKDIAVRGVCEVNPDFHSRFSAKSKLYRYIILNNPTRSVFLKDTSFFFPYRLNINLMKKESKCLIGRHDFKSFCACGSSAKNTVRTIRRVSVKKTSNPLSHISYPLIIIDIEADGFLYNMVRNIVGTLIEVGRGKFPPGSLKKILFAKNRKLAGPTASAKGLFLMRVFY